MEALIYSGLFLLELKMLFYICIYLFKRVLNAIEICFKTPKTDDFYLLNWVFFG